MDLIRESRPESITITVLGAHKVGKTSFVSRFLNGTYPAECTPTSHETFIRFVQTSEGSYQQIQVVDTFVTKEAPDTTDTHIKDSDALLVLYSVDKRKSLKKAIRICRHVLQIKDSTDTPLFLVGNKSDLKCGRGMNKEKINKFIQNRVCCLHMQSSAKTNQNVRRIFDSLIEQTLIKAVKDAMSSQRRNTHVSLCAVNGDHRPPARISKNSLESTMGSDGHSEKRYSFLRSKPSLEHVTHPPCPVREDSMKSQGDSLISTRKSFSNKSPVTVMNTQAVKGKSSFSSSERRRSSKRSPPYVSDLDEVRRTSRTAAIVQHRKSRESMTIHADNNMVMSSPHPHEVHVGVDTSFGVTRVLETQHICSGSSALSALGEGDSTNGRRRKIGMSLHSNQDRRVEVFRKVSLASVGVEIKKNGQKKQCSIM